MENRALCPVCWELTLSQKGFFDSWKCRECGTRIPDRAYFEFLLRSSELIAARRDEPEEGKQGRRE